MADSDSEHLEVKELPQHRLIHSDMPEKMLAEILFVADETCEKEANDKDIAVNICSQLNFRENEFEGGEGEWQCIVGKHFAASVQFDNKFLCFFDLIKRNKSLLIFKSG